MRHHQKECVLHDDTVCTECGECDRCDLEPEKLCDNCMKCIKSEDSDYLAIKIDGLLTPEEQIGTDDDGEA